MVKIYNKKGNLIFETREANLRGADLRGANLWGADLRGANLWGANLSEANLSEANLRGADLRGADLRGADLWGANLYFIKIKGSVNELLYCQDHLWIGCEYHHIGFWKIAYNIIGKENNYSDEQIEEYRNYIFHIDEIRKV